MSDPLSRLRIEHWWHAFTALGAAGTVAALAFDPNVISQKDALLFSFGLFLFGIGQWINHPRSQSVIPGFIVTSHHRQPSFVGAAFEIFGFVAICSSLYRMFYQAS
jgi:hypothetical protein